MVAPSTPADAKGLLLAAIRDNDPVLFLENLALYNTKGEVPDDDTPAEIGKAAVTRPGRDLTLIGYSRMAHVRARGRRGRSRERRPRHRGRRPAQPAPARPGDDRRVGQEDAAAVVLEDDWLTYGIGAEVAASISEGAFDYLDAPVRRVAMAEVPMPYAKPLEIAALPDAAAIIRVVRETLGGN